MSESQSAAPEAVAAPQPSALDILNAKLSEPAQTEASAEQPGAIEVPKVETPAAPAEVQKLDPVASKFAALSRKERELRQREQKFKTDQKATEDRIKALEAREQEFEAAWKSNPLEAMKKRGIDFKELTERYVLNEEPTAEQKQMEYMKGLESKLNALENQLKEKEELTKRQQEEQKAKSAENAQKDYLKYLTDFVNKSPDKYELVVKNDAVNLVYQVMEAHYENTKDAETGEGQLLTEEQAADKVEEYLLEEAKKLIEVNKIKSMFAPKQTQEPKKSTQSATLSNALASQVPIKSEDYLSDDESKRKAATLLKWNT